MWGIETALVTACSNARVKVIKYAECILWFGMKESSGIYNAIISRSVSKKDVKPFSNYYV